MMLAGRRRARRDAKHGDGRLTCDDPERARRFRERSRCRISTRSTRWRVICCATPADADDAVQECYLRALKHFDTFRGGPIKPWLFAILRNVCHADLRRSAAGFRRRSTDEDAMPLWREAAETPEADVLRRRDERHRCAG